MKSLAEKIHWTTGYNCLDDIRGALSKRVRTKLVNVVSDNCLWTENDVWHSKCLLFSNFPIPDAAFESNEDSISSFCNSPRLVLVTLARLSSVKTHIEFPFRLYVKDFRS